MRFHTRDKQYPCDLGEKSFSLSPDFKTYDPQEDTADLVPIHTVNQTCSPHCPPMMRAMVILSNLLVTANILHTVSYRTTSTPMLRISRNTAMTTVFGKDQIRYAQIYKIPTNWSIFHVRNIL